MSAPHRTGEPLVVVGGGVIGLTTAWRAASAGYAVTLLDETPGRGASWVAGGMLAPLTEAWPGEDPVLEFGLASLSMWPVFARELRAASGVDPHLSAAGTVLVGVDAADTGVLGTLADHLAARGHTVDRLTRGQLRRLEAGLGPAVRDGLHVPGDLAVDNRALLTALLAACERGGVRLDRRRAAGVRPGEVRLVDGTVLASPRTVIAAGAWSGALHPALRGVVRPVKGEVLRLRARRTSLPPPKRTIRAFVEGRPLYLVPRSTGELVVGATQYEAGFDADVTAGGVRDLLRDAERVLPGVVEYAVDECGAGFRAGSPDNLPLVGRLDDGVLVAAGHHRNGLLTAPVTAAAVLASLADAEPPAATGATDPARFAAVKENA